LAEVAVITGQAPVGIELFASAAALRETIGIPIRAFDRERHDWVIAHARRSVAPAAADRAWAGGSALTMDQAYARALALEATSADVPRRRDTDAAEGAGGLSTREREVLRLIAAGHTNREISEALFIAKRTADTHASNILSKLGVSSRAEAAAYAVRHGLA
jgi:DNA-binding NarL/FixJ family response regulator